MSDTLPAATRETNSDAPSAHTQTAPARRLRLIPGGRTETATSALSGTLACLAAADAADRRSSLRTAVPPQGRRN